MRPDSYRFYRLDGLGSIHDAEWFDAKDDADAAAHVEGKHPDATCEIWQDRRLVANLSPKRLSA